MKSTIRAMAEAVILQCVVYDSKSRKRAIAVYACGDDVAWADNVLGLFDVDKRKAAPQWLRDQVRKLPSDAVRLNWRGEKVAVYDDGGIRVETEDRRTAPIDAGVPVVRVPEGEDLGEDSIKQG